MQVAECAGDPESITPDCRQMRPARDEGNVVARGGEARAKIAAEAAGPHDDDTHAVPQQAVSVNVTRLPARGSPSWRTSQVTPHSSASATMAKISARSANVSSGERSAYQNRRYQDECGWSGAIAMPPLVAIVS